jgi:hypothetical protein
MLSNLGGKLMATFTGRRRVDAFVVYEAEIEGDSPADAAERARQADEKIEWEKCYTSQYDAREFVTLAEDGGEIDETRTGDL